MPADIATSLKDWSTTASSNSPSGSTAISNNLDDNLRQIQTVVRYLAASDTIASATTTDLGSKEATFLTVSGTTTITGLGTVSAGIYKWVVFSGALTLTHNGTSLILPTTANITTAAGDTALFLSLGSGNWRCLSYARATGLAIAGDTLTSPTITSPTINDGYTEEVYAVVDAAGVALSPTNGSIQTWTLGASRTPTAGTWAAGQSMTLMIDDGSAYTVTWTSLSVTWKTGAGSAPTLNTSGYTVIQLWKVGSTIYGARVGDA